MRAPLSLAISKARATVARNKLRAQKCACEAQPEGGRFAQREATVEKELFRKLPIEVNAILLSGPTTVDTLEGKMSGEKGDWLVTGVAGEQYIVQRAIFVDTFEPVDSAAKELWDRTYSAEEPAAKAEGDMAAGDLAAGGAKAPEQANGRNFRGIPVAVDRPRGHVMTGTDAQGRPWRRVYHVDYGYVPGTKGGDGEGLDVFLGGDESATDAHWILQRKADGTFDEYKVMLGFPDAKSAKLMYEMHVPKRYFGSMCSMPVEFMKALLGIDPVDQIGKALDGVRAIMESTLGEPVGKPFFGFPDFGACVAAMREQGHDEESARRICGSLQSDAEKDVMGAVNVAFDRHMRSVKLVKADPMRPTLPAQDGGEMRYVLGIVLEPEVVDAQGDVYSADEIRRSAWEYMTNFRNVGLMHKGLVNGKVRLVESYVAPADMRLEGSVIRKGTWLLGLNVADDELWGQVKNGALTGLSIGGFARRTPTG